MTLTRRALTLSTLTAAASLALPTVTLAQSADVPDMYLGDPDAPITVIEYASFTCPHCANFHTGVMPALKREYVDTGKVKFIHREVYFDRYGLWASLIARCGGGMRYFGIIDQVYENQNEWYHSDPAVTADNLRRIGLSSGLTAEQIEGCLGDRAAAETLVNWYRENATRDDVTGTPSFVINGQKHSNMSEREFASLLDGLLENVDG
ncbi:MAG: DsbA family protein [Pseudomonadota bacterium]